MLLLLFLFYLLLCIEALGQLKQYLTLLMHKHMVRSKGWLQWIFSPITKKFHYNTIDLDGMLCCGGCVVVVLVVVVVVVLYLKDSITRNFYNLFG